MTAVPFLAALALAAADPVELTLERALDAARTNSPLLRVAESEVEAARGRLIDARTYAHNPELDLEGARRDGPAASSTDRGIALSQQVEIAGQRGKRVAAGTVDVTIAERHLERRRHEVAAAVERAFARALGARELLQIAEADLALTRRLLGFQGRRMEAGAGTQLEVNLARAVAGRAERRFQGATAEWTAARTVLAEASALDPAAPPVPAGFLRSTAPATAALEDLVAEALSRRPDLEAVRQEQERAHRLHALSRSLAAPDVRVGAFAHKEEGDDITGVALGLAIPLFNRNQGGIAEARAGMSRSAAATREAELLVSREVTESRARLAAATAALGALEELVVGTLEESLDLLQGAMEAGKVSGTEVLLLRRELIDGRREHAEAAVEAWIARVELELALGRPAHQETNDAR